MVKKLLTAGIVVVGFHVAVGQTDGIRFYHVMLDSLRQYWEMRIRRCCSCRFSNGGQYLAAADGNLVTVLHTLTLTKHLSLKGHSGKVRTVTS